METRSSLSADLFVLINLRKEENLGKMVMWFHLKKYGDVLIPASQEQY